MTIAHLSHDLRDELEALVVAGYPYETCGLLIGSQENGVARIAHVVQARNLNTERAHDRYELHPEDFLVADKQARADNMEVIGIWHSHPDHPAQPSETDRTQAWDGWSYVIVAVTKDGMADLRSWRLKNNQFVEEEIYS